MGATGLCGWFGWVDPQHDPRATLTRMAGAFDARVSGTSAVTVRGAVHLVPGSPAASLYAEPELIAAVDGYPEWSDPRLASAATSEGHGAALAEAYRRFGFGLLEHLHGPFAIALLAPGEGRALLAIDRMGIHPLCFASCTGEGIVFGTTTTAVAAHPCVGKTTSPQAVFDYLFFYRVPAPITIYAEQQKLLAAQCLSIESGTVRRNFYWDIPYEEHGETDAAALSEALRNRLRSAVSRAVSGEDRSRVGAFLSGGLDSSTVTGLLTDVNGGPAKAFTIGFECPGYDETEYARVAAAHFRAEHHVYRLNPDDVCDLLPKVAAAYDEPFGNSSVVPAYYCARLARENGVDVMLAGDGGDEIFAGNAAYVRMKIFEIYGVLPHALKAYLVEPVAFLIPAGERVGFLRKARRYIAQAKLPLPQRMFEGELALVNQASHVMSDEAIDAIDPTHPFAILRASYDRARSSSSVQRMLHLDRQIVLADNDLRKVNGMCALAGVRVRYPLLDEDVVDLSAKVPPDLLIRGFRRRYFFRRALENYLPRKVLNKKKHGFGLPYERWLKTSTPLREIAYDSLASLNRRGLVRADYINELAEQHRRNSHVHPALSGSIWDLMMLELWFQHHGG